MIRETHRTTAMLSYKLVRESDLEEWNEISGLSPESMMVWASQVTGRRLHICDGPGDFWLECKEVRDDQAMRYLFSVSSQRPKAATTVTREAGKLRVNVVWVETNARLVDHLADDGDEVQQVIEYAMRRYSVTPQEMTVRRWD
jgi:hypothetical protein